MIFRKPTRIEIRQEDDFADYEEYKKKQLEQQRMKLNEGKLAPYKAGISLMKETSKPEQTNSSRLTNLMQFGNLPQDSADNQLLQSFIRSNVQRDPMDDPGADSTDNNPATNQEGRLNYIFNMLLNSVSNPEETTASNIGSQINQSFANQDSGSREMNDS